VSFKTLRSIVASARNHVRLLYRGHSGAIHARQWYRARLAGGPAAQYVPGQVIVKYKPGVGRQSKAQTRILSAGRGAAVLNEVGPPEGDKAEVIKLEPGTSVEQTVARLQARQDVLYAEPNYIYHSTYEPNDPSFGKQWGRQARTSMRRPHGISRGDTQIPLP
jgi:thermitase